MEKYLARQNEIYSRFRQCRRTLVADGIKPDVSIEEEHCGFMIAIRHTDLIASIVEDLSLEFGRLTPSVTYRQNQIHTTVAAWGIRPMLLAADNREQDKISLGLLSEVASEASKRFKVAI